MWLEAQNLKRANHKKIAPKREGLFIITEKLGPVTYRLKLPPTWKIHDVFHASLLTPFKQTQEHGEIANLRPPPELINEEEEYEVEKVLRHRKKGRLLEFLIKWKGYPEEEASWEPERNLTNAADILDQYKRRRKLSSRP